MDGIVSYVKYYKYPRTFHLPFSLGLINDDRRIENLNAFIGQRVIVTEKMDGESTSLYPDHLHARSLDSKHHPSRNWIKKFHGIIRSNIPDGYRLCGENLFAIHSIFYDTLPSYFLLFSIWDGDKCLSWEQTVEYAELLNIRLVPVLYDGIWDEDKIKACWTGVSKYGPEQEGSVVRLASSFMFDDFEKSVTKFVRKGHVQTSEHWLNQIVIPNRLNVETLPI